MHGSSPGGQADPQDRKPILIEVAWEVCNQVGGIYQVLRSKAPSMVSRWQDRYCLVGPYEQANAAVEFEAAPLTGNLGKAVRFLRQLGVEAHFGRWLVSSRPQAILLDYHAHMGRLNEIRHRLWADHGIATPPDDHLLNQCMAFGDACRELLWQVAIAFGPSSPVIAHFHEWMSAMPLPMLRRDKWPGATVFTTHATSLGRYLANDNPGFYAQLPTFNAEAEAHRFNVAAKHKLERAAAHGAHVFTTVSDVTAEECTHLLGRKPDLLLPNGLNIQRFAAVHEFQNLHRQYKQRIHQFTIAHFFPSYHFDLDKTIYMFTSGRYEYTNKGMDLTIEALARLNHRLGEANVDRTVVAFIITRCPVRSISVGALQSSAMLAEFRTIADTYTQQIGERLLVAAAEGRIPNLNTLVDEYWRLRLRRAIQTWKRDYLPPIVTHDLADDASDPVLNQLRTCRLWNQPESKVKVVFHPDFVTTSSPLFGMDYDQFVRGCHLGVFPSYYEPWGYTPLESIALGIPAVTSDLSGFGSYLAQLLPDHEQKGLCVVERRHRSFSQAADQLADYMFRFAQLDRRQRVTMRNGIESFSGHFDWHNLGGCYHEAHALALDRAAP